jgi:integrase/recombinase XerD
MRTHVTTMGPLIQSFFTQHLQGHKRVSPQTLASYRDTVRLLLLYVKAQTGKEPCSLQVTDLDASVILAFLDHLEQERHNRISSRNVRLAAVRTFFRWLALRDPESVGIAARVLAIPVKRTEKKIVQGLSRAEVEALLATPDLTTWQGRRDHALLLTLYNTGARVSEVIMLQRPQVHFGASTFVHLHGKGRKERTVPLWNKTARALQGWFRDLAGASHQLAFPNARGHALSRDGVDYLLQQAVRRALPQCPSLATKSISPHTLRHTTASHLLQSGVDLAVIALWLGHEQLDTTHMYLEADLATKERALDKLTPVGGAVPRFKAKDDVLAFLSTL